LNPKGLSRPVEEKLYLYLNNTGLIFRDKVDEA
jgi:hypothetical protein